MTARFRPGRLVATSAALAALDRLGVQPVFLVARHVSGDWGDFGTQDRASNEHALQQGGRIFSSYTLGNEVKVWVITDAVDASGQGDCTTILLPEDY